MIIKKAVILVTGGASSDYGRATVEKLLQLGASVIICDPPTKDLQIYGDDKAIFLPINTNDENDVKTLMDIIRDRYGRLDAVVNCCDEQSPIQDFTRVIHDKLYSVFNIIRLSIPLISRNVPKKTSGRGIIINQSHSPGAAAHAAANAALVAMTKAASADLQGLQIGCVTAETDEPKEFAGLVMQLMQNSSNHIVE